jgi:adenosylhomocysteine nucleosidase
MEGAAVAQVCHAFGVPLAVVRSISDRADESAHVDFGAFLTRIAGPLGLAIVQQAFEPRNDVRRS